MEVWLDTTPLCPRSLRPTAWSSGDDGMDPEEFIGRLKPVVDYRGSVEAAQAEPLLQWFRALCTRILHEPDPAVVALEQRYNPDRDLNKVKLRVLTVKFVPRWGISFPPDVPLPCFQQNCSLEMHLQEQEQRCTIRAPMRQPRNQQLKPFCFGPLRQCRSAISFRVHVMILLYET